jgi:AAA family ATP:ADP antiporter
LQNVLFLQKKKPMNNLQQKPALKKFLILAQFFLIIFIYHILKDLKDTLVITSSHAGAEIIPFIKTWAMLPFAVIASFCFTKIYQRIGREKTLYCFTGFLLASYGIFAFCLFPHREALSLVSLPAFLEGILPSGTDGFVTMIRYWFYTAFYLTAELWSMMMLSILFWGYVNNTSTIEEAKGFYPLCTLVGNCAGIISGQSSSILCRFFEHYLQWEQILQTLIFLVICLGCLIMAINRWLAILDKNNPIDIVINKKVKVSYKECLLSIVHSQSLRYIAILVVGYALTNNLIEVVWKGTIKKVYSSPQEYNAYVNTLTSLIGALAVATSFAARWLYKSFSWSSIVLITPTILFFTSLLFFAALYTPPEYFASLANWMSAPYLLMTLGSIHYVIGTTAKYTIFDMSKEMAFLSIEKEERMRAKSVIDCVGSRLGKSGASCLLQAMFIIFGSTSGQVPLVGLVCISMIGCVIFASRQLGNRISHTQAIAVPV